MSRSINVATLLGNLVRDPELKYTPSGKAVANCALATNKSWKNAEGEAQESVEFHNLVFWGRLAELVTEYCHKGSRVHVTGELQTRNWEDDKGKHYKTEINVKDVVFLDSTGQSHRVEESPSDVVKDFEEYVANKNKDDEPRFDVNDLADEIPF